MRFTVDSVHRVCSYVFSNDVFGQFQTEYFLKWDGYTESENSWEPVDHLNCPELIEAFQEDARKKRVAEKVLDTRTCLGEVSSRSTAFRFSVLFYFTVHRVHLFIFGHFQTEYLIKWKGRTNSENSWEFEKNLNCSDLIQAYEEKFEEALEKRATEKKY